MMEITCSYESIAHYTDPDTSAVVYIFECTGTYKPSPTGTQIFIDQAGTMPLYQRKLKVKTRDSSPCDWFFIWGESWGEIQHSSCSWYTYEYDSTADVDGSPPFETVKIPPYSIPNATFVSADESGTCTYKLPNNMTFTRPRQEPSVFAEDCGVWEFKSCDVETGVCAWEFGAFIPVYDGDTDFPFWPGITGQNRMRVTTDVKKAQRKYLPALCDELDYNETLIPGMRVEYEEASVDLHYQVHQKYVEDDYVEPVPDENGNVPDPVYYDYYTEFNYAKVTAPKKYHTDVSGTPALKLIDITIEVPTEEEVEKKKIITDDDFWITSREFIDKFPDVREAGHLYYAAIELNKSTYNPVIREPFGAFNDCSNAGALATFSRWDMSNVEYTCACRLDYLPYGYAVPTKTPSCFHKATAEENCAPRLVGTPFDIERSEDGNHYLLLRGGCYVPCSSLTKI